MNRPLISVIIPVYNVAVYLRACVDSVLAQTYVNLEIILVNDGSTDSSGLICDSYTLTDRRVRVVHKSNGGLSDARNAGLDAVKGDYICFVDSDDMIHREYVELLFGNIKNADMVFCDYCYIPDGLYDLSELGAQTTSLTHRIEFDSKQVLSNIDGLIRKDSPVVSVAWNKLYRRGLWENIRYPEGKIHEDEFVIHHLLNASRYISFISATLYYYRKRPGSIIAQSATNSRAAIDKIEAFMDRKDLLTAIGMGEVLSQLNGKILYHLMMPSIPGDIWPWKFITRRMILADNNLPWKYRMLVLLKKLNYRAYQNLIKLLKRKDA